MPGAGAPYATRPRRRKRPEATSTGDASRSARATSPGGDVQGAGGYQVPKARHPRRQTPTAPAVAPRSDVQASGGDFGLKKAESFEHTKPYASSLAGAGVIGVRNDQHERAQAAMDAKAFLPFDKTRAVEAIDFKIPEAHGLWVDSNGHVQLHQKATLLPFGIGDSLVSDDDIVLDPKLGGNPTALYGDTAHGGVAKEGIDAAGVKVLAQTTRPLHAIAGGIDAAVTGHNVMHGVKSGLIDNDPHTFSDVLKHLGAPEIVQSVGGFGLDVAADPTTYLSLGSTVPADLARESAAREAADAALRSGVTKEGAENIGLIAAKKADKLPQNKGLTFGLRAFGHEAKTSGKATAAVSRALHVPGVGERLHDSGPAQTLGLMVHPNMRPAGIPQAAFDEVRDARRVSRASEHTGMRRAQQRGQALLSTLKPDEYSQVIDAVEAGKYSHLPEHLRKAAVRVRDDYRHISRIERRAGIAGHPLRNYFPHIPDYDLQKGGPLARSGRPAKLGSSRRRRIREPLAGLRETSPDLFSENLPLVHASRMAKSASGVADAEYLAALARTGRPLKDGAGIDDATEAVYKVTPTGITKLERKGRLDKQAIQAAIDAGGQDHVILNKGLADTVLKHVTPNDGVVAQAGRFYDRKLQGPIKTALTVPNPQYHFTNLFGDTWNAYLGDAHVKDFVSSWRGMGAMVRRERAAKTLDGIIDKRGRGLKIGNTRMSYANLLDEAEKQGAVRTGFIARDLPELIDAQHELAVRLGGGTVARHAGPLRGAVRRAHPLRALRDASQYREDFVRLASYIGARRRGLNASAAARHVNSQHFDYADLTEFERSVLRRGFPFWTFTARNVPLQIKTLVTRPGKYATLEKAREEGAKAAGIPIDYSSQLPGYDQRGLPVPLPGPLGLLFPKLPATDLNRLPGNTLGALAHGDLGRIPKALASDLGDQVDMLLSQVTPLLKTPIELQQNYSFFFRQAIDQLASDTGGGVFNAPAHTLVPAPDKLPGLGIGVGDLPQVLRDALGIKQIKDTRTGRMIWAWPAGVDYLLSQLPFSATALQSATSTQNRHGFDAGRKVFGYLTGLKTKPFDPATNKLNDVYQQRSELQAQMTALRDQGQRNTARYREMLARQRVLNRRIYRMRKQRGDKVLPSEGAPPKPSGSSSGFGGGSGGAGFGGSGGSGWGG